MNALDLPGVQGVVKFSTPLAHLITAGVPCLPWTMHLVDAEKPILVLPMVLACPSPEKMGCAAYT